MSVKLIPRLASTGPSVKARKSRVNGRARAQAAIACWRRVGSTCRLGVGPPPDRGLRSRSGEVTWVSTDMAGQRPVPIDSACFCMAETASSALLSPLVAFSVSLSTAADSSSQVGTAGGAMVLSSC